MTVGTGVSLALALVIGLTLGALGGGGSILTLPVFVFVAGIPAQEAVAMSMVVVGGTSLLGAGLHWRNGNFHIKAALLFAATGVIGAYAGSFLTHMVSQRVLLGIFAALMLITGMAMIRKRPEQKEQQQCRFWPCLLIGAAVGVLTGFLGVGGGFLIVPALVLFAGIETKAAVGSSLAIIAVNAVGGLAGQLQQVSLNWQLTVMFLGLAMVGMFGGLFVAEKVPSESLSKAFGWFVVVLALVIGGLAAAGVRTTALN
ncbi:sulfite exporter TauE/SafE family protein [Thalassoroseus pseudoceratinae]|uniref:sulfite exporter TauE/SafE family protein n=1 Tax=Thalassoroseus pseudoceratinae TaxID=2713176 RepID=UPI00141E35E0|nr:sulfite exporter TauE/SafE family protein [Thalassoroseus pseudoceratinae]